MKKKIAFIKIGHFSGTNKSVEQQLIKHFPEFEVEVIDVIDLIKKRIDLILINIFFIIKEYGMDIILRRKRFSRCFFITSYIFKKTKILISKQLTKNIYVFSFQTQSLFDASVVEIPHFVYTDHTMLANLYYPNVDKKKTLFSKQWIELEKTIYQNATYNFTMSTNISKSIMEQYSCSLDRISCVYAGSNMRVNIEGLENKNYGNKNILFVGRNWRRKGGPELVEAFKLILMVHPDSTLNIVGCSPKLNIQNCNVLGLISNEDLKKKYLKASVFCLPTKLEPFGIVLIEAMAHKLPIVTSDGGARPDLVSNGENGYLVNPEDRRQLADALIDLIENPTKCQIFGEKGYQLVNEKYTWDQVGIKLNQYIRSVIINK
jgi:glycosyltransferase involved in cell wall biosynthesis